MSNWKFEIVDEIPENIMSTHVFFHPALVKAWLETYSRIRQISTVIVKGYSNSTEAYLPFVLWSKNWKNALIRSLVPIGYSDYDYHDPVFTQQISDKDKASFWEELIVFISTSIGFDELKIDGVTDDFTFNSRFDRGEICPILNLEEIKTEEDLMSFFKTSLRGDIRRQIRRLSEIGELKLTEYSSWDEIPKESYQEFIHQHSMRWPKAYKAHNLHKNILRYGLEAGVVHFSILSVGNIEIAWHLGFKYNGRFYYYMPAGKQEFFKYSPTKIHLFYLVRLAINQCYKVFDHLRGEENYKSGWSNSYHYVNELTKINDSSLTRLKYYVLRLRETIGK